MPNIETIELETYSDAKKLSDQDLEQFEQEHQLKLPEDYRQLMLRFNGGDLPSEDCYYLTYTKGEKRFFRNFDLDSLEDIEKFNFALQQEEGLPKHLMFIGSTEANVYYLCLGVSGEQFGKVYVWATNAHNFIWYDVEIDYPIEDRGETRDRSIKLADSLTELIASFKSIEEAKKWCPEYF